MRLAPLPTRLIASALVALSPAAALAVDAASADAITIHAPFALISPAGQSGAAFMRIENTGTQDDRLIAARADIAQRVELHTHIIDDIGTMRMMEVEEGFPIPAGGDYVLERGGDHVMFLGLLEAPEPGAEIPLTLVFESGTELTLQVPVQSPMPHAHGHGHGHGHSHGD
ncbi:MAG: copper chaperone PCu(A)C [Alkalilacustris sp.]